MPSPIPDIPIMLDRQRHLRMDLNALADFERETGASITALDFNKLSMTQTRALLWACLVQEDEGLTLRQVGQMIHPGNLEEIATALGQAFDAALPAVDLSADPNPSVGPSTGSSSGPSEGSTSG